MARALCIFFHVCPGGWPVRFPWANIALIALFTFELVTGYLGLTHSNPEWVAAMHLHRITGFAILVLFVWKSRNILGSFKTRSNWKRSWDVMLGSTVLLAGLLVVLGLGLAWSHIGPFGFMGFSGTTIHLNLALLLIPLLAWHSLRHKISFRTRYIAGRRNFLRFAGVAVAGLAAWQVSEQLMELTGAPGADRRFTGSHPEYGADFPVTMWLNDRTPLVDAGQWRLRVNGHVEDSFEMDLEELQAFSAKLTATLDCTGGWYTTREWEGAGVPELLARARVKPGAGSITIRSRTGYYRRYSMAEAGRAILATRVGGQPLSRGHGFPARMVEPNKRGYDWVKWVDEITVNDTGKFWQPPLPLS